VIYVILPSLVLRLLGISCILSQLLYQATTLCFEAEYGLWTIYHVFKFSEASMFCKLNSSLSMLNYQLLIIVGCFPAINVILVGLLCIFVVPVFLY